LVPDTSSVSETVESTVKVMSPPPAVKGPTLPGAEGRSRVSPDVGIGLGMGVLNVIVSDVVAGVAPVASTWIVAVPLIEEFPSAAAALAIWVGIETVDWKPVRLNVSPDVGADGLMVPLVSTSLRAMLPTGVPGQ